MKKIILSVFILFALILNQKVIAQVSITNNGQPPDASAMLHIRSTNKGVMIPQIFLTSLTDATTIPGPSISLLVYNYNAALPQGAGYYYWTEFQWNKLLIPGDVTASQGWKLTGNSGITDTSFIGTTDSKPLRFRTNNTPAGFFDNTKITYAIGSYALNSTTTGSSNIAIGSSALSSNTTGSFNIAIGENTLAGDVSNNNTVVGVSSMVFARGDRNTAFGTRALAGSGFVAISNNSAVGYESIRSVTTGNNNSGFGYRALYNLKTGYSNVAAGASAMYNNISANNQVAIGDSALFTFNHTFGRNTAIGSKALLSSTIGQENTAIGFEAMKMHAGNGEYNVAVGGEAMSKVTAGVNNTAVGGLAFGFGTAGNNNTAVGYLSLLNTNSGNDNSAVGIATLLNNTTGSRNIAAGMSALYSNTSGNSNIGIGALSLYSNSDKSENVAIGDSALFSSVGDPVNMLRSTGIGAKALLHNTTGFSNTSIGYNTLSINITGSRLTALGNNADVTTDGLNNATAIGANATVSVSNTMSFGSGAVNDWAFGISQVSAASHALEVGSGPGNGNGAYLTNGGVWTNTSDRNRKEDFTQVSGNEMLNKIAALPITQWKYKGTSEYHIGPVAQDFKAAFNLGVDDKSISTIDPSGIALLAIQELIKENKELKKRIEALEKK